ncbi:hypothetical protein D3C85_1063050 [compost metagenome]
MVQRAVAVAEQRIVDAGLGSPDCHVLQGAHAIRLGYGSGASGIVLRRQHRAIAGDKAHVQYELVRMNRVVREDFIGLYRLVTRNIGQQARHQIGGTMVGRFST